METAQTVKNFSRKPSWFDRALRTPQVKYVNYDSVEVYLPVAKKTLIFDIHINDEFLLSQRRWRDLFESGCRTRVSEVGSRIRDLKIDGTDFTSTETTLQELAKEFGVGQLGLIRARLVAELAFVRHVRRSKN